MPEAVILIKYLDVYGHLGTHEVRAEIDASDFMEEVRESTDIITKEGFFLVMDEKRYVYIPSSRVLQVEISLIDSEDGS